MCRDVFPGGDHPAPQGEREFSREKEREKQSSPPHSPIPPFETSYRRGKSGHNLLPEWKRTSRRCREPKGSADFGAAPTRFRNGDARENHFRVHLMPRDSFALTRLLSTLTIAPSSFVNLLTLLFSVDFLALSRGSRFVRRICSPIPIWSRHRFVV